MIFYELKLKSPPQIVFACSVEYDKYKNSFDRRKNFLEISVCEQGRVSCEYENGETEIVCPKSVLSVFSDTKVKLCAYRGEKQRHTTVGVNVEYDFVRYEDESECDVVELKKRMENSQIILVPYHKDVSEIYDELLYRLKKIASHNFSETVSGRINAIAGWYSLVAFLTEYIYGKLTSAQFKITPSELAYANKATKYIQSNYKDKITVADIASEIGLSEGYLHRIFRKVKGMGITEFLNKHRVAVAIDLIDSKKLSLKDAALNTGIEDPLYMSRLFKKITGLSAREYFAQKRIADEEVKSLIDSN